MGRPVSVRAVDEDERPGPRARPRLAVPRWLRRFAVFLGAAVATAFVGALVSGAVSRWLEHPSGPPLRFSTRANAVLDAGEGWALPRPLPPKDERWLQIYDRNDPNDLGVLDEFRKRMAEQYDGVRLGVFSPEETQFSELQMTVEGRRSEPVVIRDMRARVTRRQPPLSGTLIYGIPQGENPIIEMAFDLDSPSPVATATDDAGHLLGPYFAKRFVTLDKGEKVVFGIQGRTATCYCEWELDVYAVVDGREEKYTVRDGERPFRSTAWAPSYQVAYSFDFDAGRFERNDACRLGPTMACRLGKGNEDLSGGTPPDAGS